MYIRWTDGWTDRGYKDNNTGRDRQTDIDGQTNRQRGRKTD